VRGSQFGGLEKKFLWHRLKRQRRLIKTLFFVQCLRWRLHWNEAFVYEKSLLLLCWLFRQTSFFRAIPFPFVPNLVMGYSETHGNPRNEHFFRGITNTVLSLFRGFFSERNFDCNPNIYDEYLKNLWCWGEIWVLPILASLGFYSPFQRQKIQCSVVLLFHIHGSNSRVGNRTPRESVPNIRKNRQRWNF
jgi:hypothetical protein